MPAEERARVPAGVRAEAPAEERAEARAGEQAEVPAEERARVSGYWFCSREWGERERYAPDVRDSQNRLR